MEIDRDASVKTKIEMRKCLRPLSNQKKILFVTRLEKLKWRELSEVESDKKKKLFITSIGLREMVEIPYMPEDKPTLGLGPTCT